MLSHLAYEWERGKHWLLPIENFKNENFRSSFGRVLCQKLHQKTCHMCDTIIFPYSNQSNHWFGVLPLLLSFLKLPINTSKHTIILLIIQIHSPLKWHDFHNTGIKNFSFLCILLDTQRIVGQRVSTKSRMALISSFLYVNIGIINFGTKFQYLRKGRQDDEGKQSGKADIRQLVLTFWSTMCCCLQGKLKLLIPV